MSTTVTRYNDVLVLTIKDELAGDAVQMFLDRAHRSMETDGHQLVIDCSQLRGLDSAGLEALLDLQEHCEERLGAVKLCLLDPTCAKVLEITRLDRRFEAFPDLESAVKSYS
jgi:anti-anti-sigma factor